MLSLALLAPLAVDDCRRTDVWVKLPGATEWSWMFGSCKTLDLSRSASETGPTGAVGIAKALKGNTGIEKLWLQSSDVQDAGAIEIAANLPAGLKKLNLKNNGITDVGAAALADAVRRQYPPVLKQVLLDHNSVSASILDAINATLSLSMEERGAKAVDVLKADAEACRCKEPECAAKAVAAYTGGASRLERGALVASLLALTFVLLLWCGERSRSAKLAAQKKA